jgi:hypothetical protein
MITKVNVQMAKYIKQTEINNLEKRHIALKQEERRVKEQLVANEVQRIAMNIKMNRPGQQIDKIA